MSLTFGCFSASSISAVELLLKVVDLLGMRETSLRGLSTRKDRNIRKSTSTFASANIVIDLYVRVGMETGREEGARMIIR